MSFTGLMLRVGSREALMNIELHPSKMLRSSSDGKVCLCFEVTREALNAMAKDGMNLSSYFITATSSAASDEESCDNGYANSEATREGVASTEHLGILSEDVADRSPKIVHKQSTFFSMIEAFTRMKY
ncbi:MAG: hypothetical protein LLF94_04195 [Chlamydiales bacterium]|nr:hypothetical protein [Chlamydiales bacterium]